MERNEYYDKHYKKEGIINLLKKKKIDHTAADSKEELIRLLVLKEQQASNSRKIDWFYFLKRIFAFGLMASILGFIVDLEDAMIIVQNSSYNLLGKTIEQDAQNPNSINLFLLTSTVKDQNKSIEKLRQGLVQIDSVFKCGFAIQKLNVFKSKQYLAQHNNILQVDDLTFYIDSSIIEKYAFKPIDFGYELRKSSVYTNFPVWEESEVSLSDFVALVFRNTLMEYYNGNGDFKSSKVFDYLRTKKTQSKVTKFLAYDLNTKIGNVYSMHKFIQNFDFKKLVNQKVEDSVFSLALADSTKNNQADFPAFESALINGLTNEKLEQPDNLYLTPKQKKAFSLAQCALNPSRFTRQELENIFGEKDRFKLETPILTIDITKYSIQLSQLDEKEAALSTQSASHLIQAVDRLYSELTTKHADLKLYIDYLWFRNKFELDGDEVFQAMKSKFGYHSIVEYLNFDRLRYDAPKEAFESLNRAIEKEIILFNKIVYLIEAVAYGLELNKIEYSRSRIEELYKIIETNSLEFYTVGVKDMINYLSTILIYFETGKQDVKPLEVQFQKASDGMLTKLIFNYYILNDDLEKALDYRKKLEEVDVISASYLVELKGELDAVIKLYTNGLVDANFELNVWKRSGYSEAFLNHLLHIWFKGIEDYRIHQSKYNFADYTDGQIELLHEALYFQALLNFDQASGNFDRYLTSIGLTESFLSKKHPKSLDWYLSQLFTPSNEKIIKKTSPCFFNNLKNLLAARQNSQDCEALAKSFVSELSAMKRTKEETSKIVNPIKVILDKSLDEIWQDAILLLSGTIFSDIDCHDTYLNLLYSRDLISAKAYDRMRGELGE
ncbi:MAG: hypothetical protein AB8G15_21815 [Saprospiraceae bacterium]